MEERLLDDILINKADREKVQFPEKLDMIRKTTIDSLGKGKSQNKIIVKIGFSAAALALAIILSVYIGINPFNKANGNEAAITTEINRAAREDLAKSFIVEEDWTKVINSTELQAQELFATKYNEFEIVVEYISKHYEIFNNRYTYINNEEDKEKIKDPEVAVAINNLFQSNQIRAISAAWSENNELILLDFGILTDEDRFVGDITYITEKDLLDEPSDCYNYKVGYVKLADQWYYRYSGKNVLKEEELYKEIALNSMTEDDKAAFSGLEITGESVDLFDWETVKNKFDREERNIVVSVLFVAQDITKNTEREESILIFIDPNTKKVVGRN
jgi:hypothetical protein